MAKTLSGLKGSITKMMNATIAEALMMEGRRLTDLAYKGGDYTNRTNSLRASYGCCLYYDGKEYNQFGNGKNISPIKGVNWDAVVKGGQRVSASRYYVNDDANAPKFYPSKKHGRLWDPTEALDEFFNEYKAPRKKWHLVIVAAMPYASQVEGEGDLGCFKRKHFYRVLSFIEPEMSEIAAKYGGRTYRELPRYKM